MMEGTLGLEKQPFRKECIPPFTGKTPVHNCTFHDGAHTLSHPKNPPPQIAPLNPLSLKTQKKSNGFLGKGNVTCYAPPYYGPTRRKDQFPLTGLDTVPHVPFILLPSSDIVNLWIWSISPGASVEWCNRYSI